MEWGKITIHSEPPFVTFQGAQESIHILRNRFLGSGSWDHKRLQIQAQKYRTRVLPEATVFGLEFSHLSWLIQLFHHYEIAVFCRPGQLSRLNLPVSSVRTNDWNVEPSSHYLFKEGGWLVEIQFCLVAYAEKTGSTMHSNTPTPTCSSFWIWLTPFAWRAACRWSPWPGRTPSRMPRPRSRTRRSSRSPSSPGQCRP